jgi:hypothetical protein
VPDDLRSTAQGILQSKCFILFYLTINYLSFLNILTKIGVHFGLGRGCGSVIGGILITIFGSLLRSILKILKTK